MPETGVGLEYSHVPPEDLQGTKRDNKIEDFIETLKAELEFEENQDTSGQALKKYVIQPPKSLKIRELLNDLINFRELSMSGGAGKIYEQLRDGHTDYSEIEPEKFETGGFPENMFTDLEKRYYDLMG